MGKKNKKSKTTQNTASNLPTVEILDGCVRVTFDDGRTVSADSEYVWWERDHFHPHDEGLLFGLIATCAALQRRIETNARPLEPAAKDAAEMAARSLARSFHEHYERLAPLFNYTTRKKSAVPWKDVPASNKELMIATARAVLNPDAPDRR